MKKIFFDIYGGIDKADLENNTNQLNYGKEFMSINLGEYFSAYQLTSSKLLQRNKLVYVRKFQQYLSKSSSENYGLYCKLLPIKARFPL